MRSYGVTISLLAFAGAIGSQTLAQSSAPDSSPAQSNAAQTTPAGQDQSSNVSAMDKPFGSSLAFKKINFSLMADGYYNFNNNHPDAEVNQLYNFNDKANQWDLNLLKFTASRDPDPLGFRVDVGLGSAFDIFHTPDPDPHFFHYVEQAYVSVKPKNWKGFEADLGDFVTSAGAEVIESKDNWNYSRSLLFSFAIPYYHFGIRSSMPIGNSLNVGFQLVNGWNAIVEDHGNNMQTVGLTGAITRKKFTWSHNYYVGPQFTGVNNRNRNLYDTTLLLTPNEKMNFYLNFDYGQQRRPVTGVDHWIGFAGAAHFQLSKHIAISPRAEYYNDATGFTTGTPQKLHEVTVTGEYKVLDGLLTRLEFRRDGSNEPFFDHGTVPASSKSQTTVTLGLIAYYPMKHQ